MTDLWQPRSRCDLSCLPLPGTTPRVLPPVIVWRVVALIAVTLAGAAVLPVLPRLMPNFARAVLWCLGIRLAIRGQLPMQRALMVSNHVSWLDILVVLAVTPARLVAKHEVRDWPLVGAPAAAVGTIFIDRSRPRTLPDTVAEAADALRAGDVVAVFPEGTTWCGRSAGRYRPALFQAALDAGAPVVPVSLRFQLADGEGTTAAAFLGDETLAASLRRILAVRGLVVSIVAGAAVHSTAGMDRRTLARVAQSEGTRESIAMYRV
jgi:1-acyl-sn-glycerol-3-phosphate acyltransferase